MVEFYNIKKSGMKLRNSTRYLINIENLVQSSRYGIRISHERRNGYSWLGHYACQLLDRDFPAWLSCMEKKRGHKDVR